MSIGCGLLHFRVYITYLLTFLISSLSGIPNYVVFPCFSVRTKTSFVQTFLDYAFMLAGEDQETLKKW